MPPSRPTARAAMVALTLVIVGCGLTIRALFAFVIRCADACAPGASSDSWQSLPSAWQWEAQLHIAIAALFASTLFYRYLHRDGGWRAGLALAATLLLLATWTVFVRAGQVS